MCTRHCHCKSCKNTGSENNFLEWDQNITNKCSTSKRKQNPESVTYTHSDGRQKLNCLSLWNRQECGPSHTCVNSENISQACLQMSPPKNRHSVTVQRTSRLVKGRLEITTSMIRDMIKEIFLIRQCKSNSFHWQLTLKCICVLVCKVCVAFCVLVDWRTDA